MKEQIHEAFAKLLSFILMVLMFGGAFIIFFLFFDIQRGKANGWEKLENVEFNSVVPREKIQMEHEYRIETKTTLTGRKEQKTDVKIEKIGATEWQQERVNYAWEISNNEEFIYTLEAENGEWTHDLKHVLPYSLCWTWDSWNNGKLPNQKACWNEFGLAKNGGNHNFVRSHYDWGFCGSSDGYKKHITDDERFFTDWKWQMDQCWEMFRTGTTFYGRQNTWYTKTRFNIKK